MFTIASSEKLKNNLGLYPNICETIFEQFNNINLVVGEKKVTYCLNVHTQGMYAAFPSIELVSSNDKWSDYLGDIEDRVDTLFN
jgi:hypothetical protein